jgi:ATP-dependent Clp protease adaptor protein ClpS
VEAIVLLLGAFGATGALWTWQSRARIREEAARKRAIATLLDVEMQVALHLARHAATTRRQPFATIHVIYALVQADRVIAALDRLGVDRVALEAAIDRALDTLDPATDPREGNRMLGTALGLAKARGREMTVVDVLYVITRTPHAALLETPEATAHALLFALVHGDEPAATLAQETHVHVVVRNDDYTTQQFVVEILREVFDLPEPEAVAKMRATHETGRAIAGRFPVAVAQQKILAARSRARDQRMPLWLGVEVC